MDLFEFKTFGTLPPTLVAKSATRMGHPVPCWWQQIKALSTRRLFLLNYSPLTCLNKPDQHLHIFAVARLGL